MTMRFVALPIDGVRLIEGEPQRDERGFFARTWCAREFAEQGLPASFVQGSVSYNEIAGTLRGMHYQVEPHVETKLVRCAAGAIYDVIVDMRPASPTYLKWCGEELSAKNRRSLYIPPGCAHGFITLADGSEVVYEISEYHHPECARGVRWNDPSLGIVWPRQPARMSARDGAYPLLSVEGRR
jgi:dTDP-4-dehydrorhamnose 3,5-epimerase